MSTLPAAMAGLIGLTASDIEIQDALGIGRWEFDGEWIPHPVVRLTTTLPVAVRDAQGPVIRRVRWGVPAGGGRPVGNARDDRLLESRMWRSALGAQHAVFLSTGIYEMTTHEGRKRSWWFRRQDGHPILMPGLVFDRRIDGETLQCGAIITTDPQPFFAAFHDRQVCEIDRTDVKAWLTCTETDAATAMVKAPGPEAWEAVPVDGRIFGKGRRELEDLVAIGEPLRSAPKTARQSRL